MTVNHSYNFVGVTADSGGLNMAHLKLCMSKLKGLLIIDEVYVTKRMEYCGGEIFSLTHDEAVVSTVRCFMAKSVVGK